MFTKNLLHKLLIGLGFGVLVLVGLVLYADIRAVSRLLKTFQWGLVPVILGLTTLNYILRGFRFHYYLGQIGIKSISFWTSLRIFVGGFALTLTPGKVGELVRVLWLKNLAQVNPAKSAPLMVADRISDGLAMAVLALLGALAYPQYWPAVAVTLAVLAGGVVIIQFRPLAHWFLNWGEKLPVISRVAHHLHVLYESAYELLRLKNLLVGVGIGLVSWTAEGTAFYLVLTGLGLTGPAEAPWSLAFLAVFILALGSILGGASTLPGGLGAAEISMTGMLQVLAHLPEDTAATATLLIRFCTLWFGVALGFLTVIIWRRLLFEPAGGSAAGKAEVELAYD